MYRVPPGCDPAAGPQRHIERDQEESALTPSGASASRSEDDLGTTYRVPPGCDPTAGPKRIRRDPSEAFPRWNSLRAQNKKKEERALEIKTEKETDVKGRRTTSPPGCDPAAGPAAGPR